MFLGKKSLFFLKIPGNSSNFLECEQDCSPNVHRNILDILWQKEYNNVEI